MSNSTGEFRAAQALFQEMADTLGVMADYEESGQEPTEEEMTAFLGKFIMTMMKAQVLFGE